MSWQEEALEAIRATPRALPVVDVRQVGSVARNEVDEWSDLDVLVVAVAPQSPAFRRTGVDALIGRVSPSE